MKVRCTKTINEDSCFYAKATKNKIYSVVGNEIIDEFGRIICFLDSVNGETWFEEVKMFTKDDLKTGMVVELRDGFVGMVVGIRIVGKTKNIFISNLDENLSNNLIKDIDVMKVYEEPQDLLCFLDLEITNQYNIIWEREEKSQVQIEIEQLKKERDDFNKKMDERLAKLESM